MASDAATVKALRATDLFSSLSRRSLETVASSAKVVKHPAGKELVSEGTSGIGFHLITEGTASVVVGGKRRGKLGPGKYFGEMSLVDGGPRSATIISDTPVTTIYLSAWNFRPILKSEPEVTYALLLAMCGRLRAAEKR